MLFELLEKSDNAAKDCVSILTNSQRKPDHTTDTRYSIPFFSQLGTRVPGTGPVAAIAAKQEIPG
jgi:hypothetical protein